MNHKGKITVLASILLVFFFVGSVFSLRAVEGARGKEATLEDVLYLPSSKVLKRMSLGYSGLLANIYWTRAVQYFGSRHIRHATRYDLLYPLLDITTDLDPHIIPAYEYGSVFLSQEPPNGAGQPDKAVALVEKGIRENPTYWRLYFTLGFIHYIDRDDPKAARDAFERGANVPGALPWMKVMAARMAERSKDIGTSIALWQVVLQTTTDKYVKQSAENHLASIQADVDINHLQRAAQEYRNRTGAFPSNWDDMIRLGLLRGTPTDPYGEPYLLKADGVVDVKHGARFPYLGEWRYNEERPF